MRYSPSVTEWAHILNIRSPRAYQAVRKVLPLPNPRTLQISRAQEPGFPVGIQDRTFERVVNLLQKLNYDCPCSLACDDTKLTPSLHPYWDADRGCYVLLGSTISPPPILPDPDQLTGALRRGEIEKATQLRVWTLQAVAPGVPTIVVATLPISSSADAEDLKDHLKAILFGLLKRNINVAMYAVDGSAKERKIERYLASWAEKVVDYTIPHPVDRSRDYHVRVAYFRVGDSLVGVAIGQDPEHGRKSLRNALFSGARVLTLGEHVAAYSDIRKVAFADLGEGPASPLFHRDIEKLDRQDDNAATRVFCTETLQWLTTHLPDRLGTIVYCYVYGELPDAYLNRSILLADRVHIVLHVHYFTEIWLSFLERAEYPKATQCLSKDTLNIVQYLVDGLMQSIYIFRDQYHGRYPLLPWKLGTSGAEHVFGAS
ncbi:hypothetical protein OF83DRAFT_1073220 [Amylostereum chailletii]|nr:hypothetical protein OF83DRAFT_1073220 [Amylostereum chailletii]